MLLFQFFRFKTRDHRKKLLHIIIRVLRNVALLSRKNFAEVDQNEQLSTSTVIDKLKSGKKKSCSQVTFEGNKIIPKATIDNVG
mmetsp:Transcript_30323/g.41575  ORF Transcript_30323/g.41575 Transcript_30323/m.41575 type:complete len:84 (+) Transcript_30323:130-381(+)